MTNSVGVLSLSLPTAQGRQVALSELVQVRRQLQDHSIVHKDQQPMIMVTGDMAGRLDSPLYGMADIAASLGERHPDWAQSLIHTPSGLEGVAVHWGGEWKITYETFRDMGIAYSVGIVLIYFLVVAVITSYSIHYTKLYEGSGAFPPHPERNRPSAPPASYNFV